MESVIHEELHKNRGLGATLKVAYSVFLTHFQRIFKHIWKEALAFSLLAPFMYVLNMSAWQVDGGFSWWSIPFIILTIVVEIMLWVRIAQLINDESWKWNLKRVLKLFIWIFVLSFVLGIIIGLVWLGAFFAFDPQQKGAPVDAQLTMEQISLASLKIMAVVGLVSLVLTLLLLPYIYVFTKYVADAKSTFKNLVVKGFRVGMRRWGYIFATTLLLILIVTLISVVVCLPMIVIVMASVLSLNGVAMGDPSGLPSSFPWLVYAVFAATYFVLTFVIVYVVFVCYYMYGTIETREEERKAAHEISKVKITEGEL